MHRVARMSKATVIASGVTMASAVPLFVFHVVAPIFAPMVGGYWAGSNLALTEGESALLALLTAIVAGAPLPVLQQGLGFFHYLSPVAIDIFAATFALYAGGLTGIFAWWGGSVARSDIEERGFTRQWTKSPNGREH
jgi:hypothetical protein